MEDKENVPEKWRDGYKYGKIVNGGVDWVALSTIVGYCHFKEHSGFITKNVLKEKDCYNKGCSYFERYDECPYWAEKARKKEIKTRRKMVQQAEKRAKEELSLSINTEACRLIEIFAYPIKVVGVTVLNKNDWVVRYLSNSATNDEIFYYDIALKLSYQFKVKIMLRKQKV